MLSNTISVEYPTLSKRLVSDNTFYEMLESNISVFRVIYTDRRMALIGRTNNKSSAELIQRLGLFQVAH